MAIQIRQHLTASPNPTPLPRRVEFRQTLRSNRPSEAITVVYSLDPVHNVWFQDAAGAATKTITRQETVGQTDQVCIDRIGMQEGPGQGPQDLVQVNQTITGSSGISIPDTCVVEIQR
jgi:hypothetical protein